MIKAVQAYMFANSLLPQTRAILAMAMSQNFAIPERATVYAMDRLIRKMLINNIWEHFDTFLNGAYNDNTLRDFTRINWKRPFEIELTDIGSDVIYSENGWKAVGSGFSTAIDTKIGQTTPNRIITDTNAHFMGVVFDISSASVRNDFLISAAGTNGVDRFHAFNTNVQRIMSSGATNNLNSAADLSGTGMKTINRYSATNVQLTNKSVVLDRTSTGGTINATGYILIFQNSSTIYSKLGLSCYSIGTSLHGGKHLLLRTIYNEFLTEIGLTAIA